MGISATRWYRTYSTAALQTYHPNFTNKGAGRRAGKSFTQNWQRKQVSNLLEAAGNVGKRVLLLGEHSASLWKASSQKAAVSIHPSPLHPPPPTLPCAYIISLFRHYVCRWLDINALSTLKVGWFQTIYQLWTWWPCVQLQCVNQIFSLSTLPPPPPNTSTKKWVHDIYT